MYHSVLRKNIHQGLAEIDSFLLLRIRSFHNNPEPARFLNSFICRMIDKHLRGKRPENCLIDSSATPPIRSEQKLNFPTPIRDLRPQ